MANTTRPVKIQYTGAEIAPADTAFRDVMLFFDERLPDGTRKGSAILAMIVDDAAQRARGLVLPVAGVCCLSPDCPH